MAVKKRGLGRGLDALLNTASLQAEPVEAVKSQKEHLKDGQLKELPIELLQRGKYQPRRDMSQEALDELAQSIKAQGVMQPIIVRSIDDGKYEIIAGERRWRASQLARLERIPVVIKDVPDEAAVAMSLIENIQREDLNPIEEAIALYRLQTEFELTQQEVANAIGKSRSTVTNLLRLMSLNEDVQKMLEYGDIEMGHARALLVLSAIQQSSAANMVVSKGLSVRQTEAMVRRLQQEINKDTSKTIDPDIKKLEDELTDQLGSVVMLQHSAKGKGRLLIKYNNLDELDSILSQIKKDASEG